MPPLREFECMDCKMVFETLIRNGEDLDDAKCPSCGSNSLDVCFSYPGNYLITGNNAGSTRPKRMGGNK